MDTKRLIIAVILSVAIFFGWNALSVYMGWIKPAPQPVVQNATQQTPAPAPTATPGTVDAAQASGFHPESGSFVTVDTPLYRAVFHSQGGVLREFSLKKYREGLGTDSPLVNLISNAAWNRAPMGLLINGAATWTSSNWILSGSDLTLKEGEFGSLRFTGEVNGITLVRELIFTGDAYTIAEKTNVTSAKPENIRLAMSFNASQLALEKQPSIFQSLRHLVLGGEKPVPGEVSHNMTRVAWLRDNSFDEDVSTSDLTEGKDIGDKVSWVGVMSNYFLGAVSMPGADGRAGARYAEGVYQVSLGKTLPLESATPTVVEAAYYLGPKDAAYLNATPNSMGRSLDYGMFSVIAKPLVMLLKFFNSYVHNYGVAIILMTVLIKLIFWPLSQKSYKSMEQMKKLQPLMVKVREKYADDKETMNKEIMQLYKTYKVNPAGGCLPMIVQIPVFFGLYQALLNAIELRQTPFILHFPFTDKLWLADLSARDPYLITPLVMGATMFLQQKLTPTPGDPTQARVMMFMPLIFTVLFITFPSGLVLYWLVNNVISICQQWWMLRRA